MKLYTHTARGGSADAEHFLARKPKYENLADRSPEHGKPWDFQRATADRIALLYSQNEDFERLAERMGECSGRLAFALTADTDGVLNMKLRQAHFCRVRLCPVCQWRRSLMLKARFYKSLPTLIESVPGGRWLFVTLTVRNTSVSNLRNTLGDMSRAWNRFTQKPVFRDVLGWVRTTEVTRGKDGDAHPHYHVLMLVKSTYFKTGHYVTHADWTLAWQAAARLDYTPVVDVRAVRSKTGDKAGTAVMDAVSETLKYAVKPSDMEADGEWFFELTRQIHRLRFVASGGTLKGLFADEKEVSELIVDDANDSEEGPQLVFNWSPSQAKYRRKVKA